MGKEYTTEKYELFNALILDDNEKWSENKKSFFLEVPPPYIIFNIDCVKEVEEAAEKVRGREYFAVIADILLKRDDLTAKRGDTWFIENIKYIQTDLKYIITANENFITKQELLTRYGIGVISKSTREEQEILRKIVNRAMYVYCKKRNPDDSISEATLDEMKKFEEKDEFGKQIFLKSKDIFLDWLSGVSDNDTKDIWFGSSKYSINDMIINIQKSTEIGNIFMEMFIDHIGNLIKMPRKKKV